MGQILTRLGSAGDHCFARRICAVDIVPFYRAQKGLYPVLWEVFPPASAQENFSVLLLVLDEYGNAVAVANSCSQIRHKG